MTGTVRPTRVRIGLTVITVVLVAAVLGLTYAAEQKLGNGRIVDLGLLQLRLTYNPGVAFSLGAGQPTWVVLTLTGLITAGIAIYTIRTAPSTPLTGRVALAAVLAGAMSNLLDRADDGAVTDYLHTGWFPTFNLADTLITLGAALLILTTLRHPTTNHKQHPADTP